MDVKSGDKIKIILLKTFKKIKNKAIRILHFKGSRAQASNLYKESNMYTLKQITTIENCRFVYDQIMKNLPKKFNNSLLKRIRINIIQDEKNWMFQL